MSLITIYSNVLEEYLYLNMRIYDIKHKEYGIITEIGLFNIEESVKIKLDSKKKIIYQREQLNNIVIEKDN